MLALLRYLWRSWWKATESDFKWHFLTKLKRSLIGRFGVWHVLDTLLSGAIAVLAWFESQQRYIAVLVFLAVFALIGIIISFVREMLTRIEWLKEVEKRNLKQQHEKIYHFISRGETIEGRCRTRESNFKIDEAFPQWEVDVLYFLDCFSDADHVNRFLNTSDVMPRPEIAGRVLEEEKEMYLLLRSRITRLRQFYEEVERKSPPGTFDVRQSTPFQSL